MLARALRLSLMLEIALYLALARFAFDASPATAALAAGAVLVTLPVALVALFQWGLSPLFGYLMLAYLVIFSSAYYLLAMQRPGEFSGLNTRLDALYFSMTTMSTVGYGDITASGQIGRALVTVQLVFNLIFVAALVALVQDQIRRGEIRRWPRPRTFRGAESTPEPPSPGEDDRP